MRTVSKDGHIATYLIASKLRVTLVKSLSIPRLELCGALVLAQLIDKLRNCLDCRPLALHITRSTLI